MLIDEMHPSLLGRHAFPVATFHEAGVLQRWLAARPDGKEEEQEDRTYRVFTSVSFDRHKGVMILLDVQPEQISRGEVLTALETPVGVGAVVMGFVLGVGRKHQYVLVWRQRTLHLHPGLAGAFGGIQLSDLGSGW